MSIWVCDCGAPLMVSCASVYPMAGCHHRVALPRVVEKAEEPLLRGMASAIASIEAYVSRQSAANQEFNVTELDDAKAALLMAFKETR